MGREFPIVRLLFHHRWPATEMSLTWCFLSSTPGTNLRLDYSVDERKHQVKLISVAGQR